MKAPHTLHLYLRLAGAVTRSQMQYRVSFLVDSVGVMLTNLLEFFAFALAFGAFGSIGGWPLARVAFLWGLSEMAFATMDMLFSGFDPAFFSKSIKRGAFDQMLLRPVNLVAQVFASDVALRRLGRVAQGAAIFVFALANLGMAWPPEKILYLALVFAGAVCFYGALFVLGAALCFWTTESLEIVNIFTYGGTTMASYPMHIYNDFLRRVFTFVIPTAIMIYYPALYFFDLPDPLGLPRFVSFLAPITGAFLLMAALLVWRFGVGKYQSAGA